MSAVAELILRAGYAGLFAVPGVPVTQALIHLSAKKCVVACRTEQAAANAAAAFGYQAGTHALTSLRSVLPSLLSDADWNAYEKLQAIGGPGLCITTSGPAFINALSGVATAAANCWPLVVLSSTLGNQHDAWFQKFQRYPQAKIAESFECIKKVYHVASLPTLAKALCQARIDAVTGVPGPVMIECEWDLWASGLDCLNSIGSESITSLAIPRAKMTNVSKFSEAFKKSTKPLFIFGKGLAFSGGVLAGLLLESKDKLSVPMLMSPMGKGILSETDARNCGACRSYAMKESDAVFVFGARLNWMFDCASGWLDNKHHIHFFNHGQELGDVFHERFGVKTVNDDGDGMSSLAYILDAHESVSDAQRLWFEDIRRRCDAARSKVTPATCHDEQSSTRRWKGGRTFAETFEIIHNVSVNVKDNCESCPWWLFGSDPTSYVIEGATSMDKSRIYLPINHPKQRMDAATLGAMGLGAPFALGVAMWKHLALKALGLAPSDGAARVVLIQGDHAFGFSGMEIETIGRYKLPVKMVVLDNGGMYAMDPSEKRENVHLGDDPVSKQFAALSITDLSSDSHFNRVAEAFRFPCALRVTGNDRKDLQDALQKACSSEGPALVSVTIDPLDGSKAGFIAKLH